MIANLRNFGKDERCFIVGNGASLNVTPLELLRDDGVTTKEYTFATNMISLMFGSTAWRPTYMVLTTTALDDPQYQETILKGIRESEWAFIWDRFKDDLAVNMFENITWIPVIHDGPVTLAEARNSFWPKDISKGVSKFATTTFAALQIAVYMGFNPIYLVGVDMDWKPFKGGDTNHFHPDYNSRSLTKEKYASITKAQTKAYRIALAGAKKAGVEIFDATIDGKLDVFEKVDYRSLFKVSKRKR